MYVLGNGENRAVVMRPEADKAAPGGVKCHRIKARLTM